jgi:hypothetical protein
VWGVVKKGATPMVSQWCVFVAIEAITRMPASRLGSERMAAIRGLKAVKQVKS